MAPKNQSRRDGHANRPVNRIGGDESSGEHAERGEQKDGNQILAQLAQLYFQAAFKEKGRQEDDQNDVGSEPVGPLRHQLVDDRQMDQAERKSHQNQRDRVGYAQDRCDHRDNGSREQQSEQELDGGKSRHREIRFEKNSVYFQASPVRGEIAEKRPIPPAPQGQPPTGSKRATGKRRKTDFSSSHFLRRIEPA